MHTAPRTTEIIPGPLLGMLKTENVLSSGIAERVRISLELLADLDITRQNLPENEANREKSEGKGCDKPD